MTRCPLCGRQQGDEEGFTERLIAGLQAEEASVVQHAADILGKRGDERAVAELIRLLETSTDEFVLQAAARAVGEIGHKSAIGPLCQVVETGPRAAREAACVALARLRAAQALPALHQAARSLGASGLRAIDYLEGRVADPPADSSARWAHRPALGDDPMALVRRAIRAPGCAICALMSEDLSAFLSQWQYFSAVVPAAREHFCEKAAFCPEHAEIVRRTGSARGLDPSLADLLAHLAERMERLASASSAESEAVAPDSLIGHERTCEACGVCAAAEGLYIQALATLMREPGFSQFCEAGSGICIPHFLCLREEIEDRGLRERAAATQASHLRRLVDEMQSHLRKCSEGLAREATTDEQQAAWRALRMLSGKPEVKPGISRRLARTEADQSRGRGR